MTTRTVQIQVTMNAQGHVIAETYKNGCRTQERILSLNHMKELLASQQEEVNRVEKLEEEKRQTAARALARENKRYITVTHGALFLDRIEHYQNEHKTRSQPNARQEADKANAKALVTADTDFDL